MMRLSQASDFALRILMLLDTEKEPITVEQIAQRLHLVKSHVMKIIAKLSKAGFVKSNRGRAGGISLGHSSNNINVGEVVRVIENDFAIVACMQEGDISCVFLSRCKLRGVMVDAQQAFLNVLDQQTLSSISSTPNPPPAVQ